MVVTIVMIIIMHQHKDIALYYYFFFFGFLPTGNRNIREGDFLLFTFFIFFNYFILLTTALFRLLPYFQHIDGQVWFLVIWERERKRRFSKYFPLE